MSKKVFEFAFYPTNTCSRLYLSKKSYSVLALSLIALQSYSFAHSLNNLEAHNKANLVFHSTTFNPQNQVKGFVFNEKGEPLSGVNVKERGTSNAVLTGSNGSYSLTVKNTNAVLEFSYVGFLTTERKVSDNLSNVILQNDNKELDEVVVVGYGTQKKQHLTGAVSSIDGKELQSRPVQNVGQALQGLMPGLNVQAGGLGGELNQKMGINVRGAGTIGAGSNSSPLVLIDGMEGDLFSLNPQDIENISVFKGCRSHINLWFACALWCYFDHDQIRKTR